MSDAIEKAVAHGLEQAADAMFMEAAPDEAPLAMDCPGLHAELVKQSAATILAFLRSVPSDATAGRLLAALVVRRP